MVAVAVLAAGACAALCFLMRERSAAEPAVLYPDAYSREYYLNLCGWEVTLLTERTVTIPEAFNEVYARYNRLQERQGLPLAAHKGSPATLYTYSVDNYGGAVPVRAELLICEDLLVGAGLYSTEQGGFYTGLRGEAVS